MRPWLRLLERIHDLPIEQLDQHMARTLADELGVPYQPVSTPEPHTLHLHQLAHLQLRLQST
jgi:hypothetical protein